VIFVIFVLFVVFAIAAGLPRELHGDLLKWDARRGTRLGFPRGTAVYCPARMSRTTENPFLGRVLLIVPAYNEAANLPAVLADAAKHAPWADVVVVDDCSADDTVDVASALGAAVLPLPCNLGVGGAMQTGYLYAWRGGYDVAVQFDGDGQHRADQIPALAEGIRNGADLVVGSRLIGRKSYRFSVARWLGILLLKRLLRLLNGVRVSDPTSGFRAASRRMIGFFSRYYPHTYLGDTVEALATAARHGMKLAEAPTRMRMVRTSSVNNLIGLLHTLRTCLALLVDRLERPFAPIPAGPPTGPAPQPDTPHEDAAP
jgi:hypothetical protein